MIVLAGRGSDFAVKISEYFDDVKIEGGWEEGQTAQGYSLNSL